jgi:hypothetical protein
MASRPEQSRLKKLKLERRQIAHNKITHAYWSMLGGVPLKDREGVYVHSFQCNICGLHFNIYSWLPDRHRSDNVKCPECGQSGAFRHYRAQISESADFSLSHPGEIFRHNTYPGSSLMDDTTVSGMVKKEWPK